MADTEVDSLSEGGRKDPGSNFFGLKRLSLPASGDAFFSWNASRIQDPETPCRDAVKREHYKRLSQPQSSGNQMRNPKFKEAVREKGVSFGAFFVGRHDNVEWEKAMTHCRFIEKFRC